MYRKMLNESVSGYKWGSKFDESLKIQDNKTVAKLIRSELLVAKKSGVLPKDLKLKVTSGVHNLSVTIESIGSINVYSESGLKAIESGNIRDINPTQIYSKEYKDLMETLKSISNIWNTGAGLPKDETYHVNIQNNSRD